MYLFMIRLWVVFCLLTGCQTSLGRAGDKTKLLTIDHLSFSLDGYSLAYTLNAYDSYSYSQDKVTDIGIWGIKSGKVKKAKKNIEHKIETVFLSPNGKKLALIYKAEFLSGQSKTNYGFIWDIDQNEWSKKQSYIPSYIGPKSLIAVSPNKQLTAQPDLKGRIRLWDNATQKIVNTYQFEHIKIINAIQFTPDNKRLVVVGQYLPPYYYRASEKNKYPGPTLVVSFDLSKKSKETVLDTKSNFLNFQKQSHRLMTQEERTVKIWDSLKQTLIQKIDYVGKVMQMQLSSDGRYLVAIIHSNMIILPDNQPIEMENRHVVVIWDIKTGLPLHVLTDGTRSINSIAISPDNKTLATGDDEGMIRLWNMKKGAMINSLAVSGLEQ